MKEMTDVLIRVEGTQVDRSGMQDTITLITPGKYFHKHGVHYLTYRETAVSGMEGATTFIKIDGEQVVLVRMGTVELRQVFRTGVKNYSLYRTPYGTLELGVVPSRVAVTIDNGVGEINLEYELEIGGELQSKNCLHISVREES